MPSVDTCEGASFYMMTIDKKCPKQCDPEDAKDGLPKCTEGQKERTVDTCGTDTCEYFLASLKSQTSEMKTGLKSCASHSSPHLQHLAKAADMLEVHFAMLVTGCGFSIDKLTTTTTTT